MNISNIKHTDNTPAFIEVRNYPNRIVNVPNDKKPKKSDFVAGIWKIHYFINPVEKK